MNTSMNRNRPSGMVVVGHPSHGLTPGDVLSYTPLRAFEPRHCREGMALVDEHGRAFDTFWGIDLGDRHCLTAAELATATVVFNVGDFEMLDKYSHSSRGRWETYNPLDRAVITSQHGLQAVYYVRKGAQPDLETQIENARERVEDAERQVRSAQSGLEWRRRELAALEEVSG